MAAMTKKRLYAIRAALLALIKGGEVWDVEGRYGRKDIESALEWANEKIADKERKDI